MNNGEQFFNTAAGGGYAISRSLRFNSSDSAYLSRTPASAGNRKTWTWAGWVKRSALGSGEQNLFGVYTAANNNENLQLTFTADAITLNQWSGGYILYTSAVYRDTSAWYHIVLSVDTTQATAANRIKLYVNGSQVTAFSSTTYPAQNTDLAVNQATQHEIGVWGYTSLIRYFPGYLADVHFIDGQALDPTSFGEFDATTGVWNPKAYTGSYGTNGFQLKFADNSSNTATTLGKDTSGNSNNWTPNNLSVTAGAGNDSLVDVPTNGGQTDTGAGGEVRGNYATFNPLDQPSSITLSNGNLDFANSSGQWKTVVSTIAVSSGKWYAEFTPSSGSQMIGIVRDDWNANRADSRFWASATGYAYHSDNGQKYNNDAGASYGSTYAGEVIGVAMDLDAGTLVFYKNNTSQGTAFTGLTGTFKFAVGSGGSIANWGARPFAYTAPSGFKALNTANLPAPVVTKPSTVMDVKLYTGNASTQTISGLGFESDLLWFKRRDSANSHILIDQVRGLSKQLVSNATDAEGTDSTGLTAVSSTGFTLGAGNVFGNFNANGGTFAAWCWDAGSSTVTNTVGSISSQVRANATAGFSIVTYTGTGSAATVGHGLGVAPSMIIVKSRNTGATNWGVYHAGVSATPQNSALNLDNTAAIDTQSVYWNNTAPTSTVFSVGTWGGSNGSTRTYVAYCFAPVSGYSSFGSYTGGGSEYPFVYCGFRPRWIMIKNASTGGTFYDWHMVDTARNPYNFGALNSDSQYTLFANTSGQEQQWFSIDILSNGFRVIDQSVTINSSGSTFVYACFAESPFQYARAR